MIDVITSFLTSIVEVKYVPHMFVCIGVCGLVAVLRRFIMNNL